MKKLTLVVQRYGQEFAGGSEYLARWLVLHLQNYFEIEVLTTTAIDAVTWENHFPPGVTTVDGIKVHRFSVTQKREYDSFIRLSRIVFSDNHSLRQEFEWLESQGPVCPDLLEYIDGSGDKTDLYIFLTYLYYPTYFGMHHVHGKSVFIPTAHEEPPIFLTIYRHIFNLPTGIIFLAEEEKEFILKQFHPVDRPWIVTGIGIDDINGTTEMGCDTQEKMSELPDRPYIFSCGRIESSKGYEELFTNFLRYEEEHGSVFSLVLAGNANMSIPESENIIYKGFVSEEEKQNLIQHASGVVISSPLESFSLLALEAWKFGKAVIANGNSRVLEGHIQRSDGGFIYKNFKDFKNILLRFENHPDLVIQQGYKGKKYARENYSGEIIANKYRNFLLTVLSL